MAWSNKSRLTPLAIASLCLAASAAYGQDSRSIASAALEAQLANPPNRSYPTDWNHSAGESGRYTNPITRTVLLDSIPAVSGSLAFQTATGRVGSATVALDAPGDFRTGQYVEIDHAGQPCALWSAGRCGSLDDIAPTITLHGMPGLASYCVQISVMDPNGGVSRPLNPAGGTCIWNAPETLDSTNYVKIQFNRARKNGKTAQGDQAYAFWISTNGPGGPWTKRGVLNEPTAGVDPIVDDMGGAKLVYDPDLIPLLNTTEPQTPDPSEYWWVPDNPPAADLNDWLLTRIVNGGGSETLTLADPIASLGGVEDQRISHDDGPPIQALFSQLRPNTHVIFGPHHYRFFKLMFGNGGRSLSLIAIGDDPSNDSGTVIAGAGMDLTFIEGIPCYNAGDGIQVSGSAQDHVQNVEIEDLTVDNHACGFLPNGPTSAALDTSYADGVTIQRVRATNGATATVWVADGANDYHFDSSEAEGGWGDVFHGTCRVGQCPRGLWVTNSNFPYGGADGGFGVLSETSNDSPHQVYVQDNNFGCGAGFQGCTSCAFSNNKLVVNNPHFLDAGLFALGGANLYGNFDLDIGFNSFHKEQRYGYDRSDQFGDPPAIVQIGNAGASAHAGGPIKFHDNTISGRETYGIFLCAGQAQLYSNQVSGFSGRQPILVCPSQALRKTRRGR